MKSVRSTDDGHSHGHSHNSAAGHDDSQEVWIGMTALCGICMFFTVERLLNAVNVWKRKRDAAKRTPVKVKILDKDVELSRTVGEKLSKHRYNSYGYCYDGVKVEMLQGLNDENKDELACYEKPPDSEVDLHNATAVSEKKLFDSNNLTDPSLSVHDSSRTIVLSEHSTEHHGHGHNHAHTHEVPQSVSATAWMVIAGDGLHNFSDGMAIGAAFANGLTGGLSTAIAVFCHELPHELGDFALLLKAGMGIRQALFYNGMSSLLCFLGMIVGLAIGNIESANSWVFAGAAGMFLYIALVDMMPELNTENGFGVLTKFTIQAAGIATGITIMCLIALYEHDLHNLIQS